MNEITIVSVLAVLAGSIYIFVLRKYDMYEPEPLYKMFLAAFLGGIMSVMITLGISEFLDVGRSFFDAVVKIGLVEESAKLLALAGFYLLIRKEFNEIVDGIIYISCVALGFAVIENVLYALSSENTYALLMYRSVICITGHMVFAGYMGVAFFIHTKVHKNYTGILLAVCLSAIAHGLYDGFLFHDIPFFNFLFIALVMGQLWFLRIALSFSRQRDKLDSSRFGLTGDTSFGYCVNCESEVKNDEYRFWKVRLTFCDQCGYLVLDRGNWNTLMGYYRPLFRWNKQLKEEQNQNKRMLYLEPEQKVQFNVQRQYGSAEEAAFSDWLHKSNIADRRDILDMPVVGWILEELGIKYMVREDV